MKVVGVDKLQRLAAEVDPARAAGAWLAEMRDSRFEEVTDLLARYPRTLVQADGSMRMPLTPSNGWVVIRMNCAAGVVLVIEAGGNREARA